jgi:hypothetical protein
MPDSSALIYVIVGCTPNHDSPSAIDPQLMTATNPQTILESEPELLYDWWFTTN